MKLKLEFTLKLENYIRNYIKTFKMQKIYEKMFYSFFPIYKNILDTKILRKSRKDIKKMKEKLQKAKKNNTVKFLFFQRS